MRDLANAAGILARHLTSVADALAAEGLVRRVPHPVDLRATLLDLTSDGRAAIENDLAPRLLAMSRFFDVLSPAEKSELTAALGALSTAMEADGGA